VTGVEDLLAASHAASSTGKRVANNSRQILSALLIFHNHITDYQAKYTLTARASFSVLCPKIVLPL
jgi:hypothetical protein